VENEVTQRTALVTGCSSGFGLGIACALRDRGWQVLAGVRDAQRAPAALAGCEVVRLDVGDAAQIAAMGAAVERLDCLINNAGYALTGPLATQDAQQMRTQLEVNLLGPALLIQALLPALGRARGRVINVGSIAGDIGLPLNALYSASKAALHALGDALRRELADHGVQLATVIPGGFRTRFMANMVWGTRAAEPGTIEARQLDGYRAFQQRLASRPGRAPEALVQAVVRLSECVRMPPRVRVGSDARIAHLLPRWLPARWADALLTRVFRRQMQAGKR
jgi:NAD(P)-dependent dehydrogenase (short-subunit alcohol dehydrogenase family)